MTIVEKFLIGEAERPSWLVYPEELVRLVSKGSTQLIPWRILEAEYALPEANRLKERYDRDLVPFAYRQDTDDLACFEQGSDERVKIIHNHASKGWENEREHESFDGWLKTVKEQMSEWS